MAGVVNTCKNCGTTIWDDCTVDRLCFICVGRKSVKTPGESTDPVSRLAALEAQIVEAKEELRKMRAKLIGGIQFRASEIPPENKQAIFDDIHAAALNVYMNVCNNGYESPSVSTEIYRMVMKLFLGGGAIAIMDSYDAEISAGGKR
jgi:hypothetical protein